MGQLKYKRILLKLTGESMAGAQKEGVLYDAVREIAKEIKEVQDMGAEIAVVIGGGNILRGSLASAAGIDRTTADYMGMLATVINGLALQSALEQMGAETRMQTSITMSQVAEPFVRRRAVRHLEKKTGSDFFGWDRQPLFYH